MSQKPIFACGTNLGNQFSAHLPVISAHSDAGSYHTAVYLCATILRITGLIEECEE